MICYGMPLLMLSYTLGIEVYHSDYHIVPVCPKQEYLYNFVYQTLPSIGGDHGGSMRI